jgi:hypothetical protein
MWKLFWVVVFSIAGVAWAAQAPITVEREGPAGGARVRAYFAGWLVYDHLLPEADVDPTARWLGLGILGTGLVAGAVVGLLLAALGAAAFRRGWFPRWLLLSEGLAAALLAAMPCFLLGAAGLTHTADNGDGTQTVTVYRYGFQVYQTTGPRGTLDGVHAAFLFGLGGVAALIGGGVGFLLWRWLAAPVSSGKGSGAV